MAEEAPPDEELRDAYNEVFEENKALRNFIEEIADIETERDDLLTKLDDYKKCVKK